MADAIQVPINDMGEMLNIEMYSEENAVLSFTDEEEGIYLDEAIVDVDKLPGVIKALQDELGRLKEKKDERTDD